MHKQLVEAVLGLVLRDDLRFRLAGQDWDTIHVPEELRVVLSELASVKEIVGKNLNLGVMNSTFQVDVIAQALVSKALDNGVKFAVDSLFEFLDQNYNPCVEVILLRGIKVSGTFELFDSVFISRPEDVPSETLKRFIKEFPEKSRPHGYMSPTSPVDYTAPVGLPDSVLFRLSKVRPKFLQVMDLKSQKFDIEDIMFLTKVSELLSVVFPKIPINRRGYLELQEGAFLQGFTPRNYMAAYREAGSGACYNAGIEELELLRKLLSAYFDLSANLRKKFEVPIHRLNEAIRHDSPVDQAIDLGIALESLLLSDQGDKVQLALQFRLRGAWLLGRDVKTRQDIYRRLRDLYNYRSSAVHSGRLDNSATQEKLVAGFQLCADAIKALIFAKSVNWDDIVLGGD